MLRVTDKVIVASDPATTALMRIDAELIDLRYKLIDVSDYVREKLTGS